MRKSKIIMLIEIVIIIILVLIIVFDKINIGSKEDIFEVDIEYTRMSESGGINVYEVGYQYDPNEDTSYFQIEIYNTTDDVYSLNGLDVSMKTKEDGKVKYETSLDVLADIDPGDFIKYSYQVEGYLFTQEEYDIEYVPKKN